MTAVVRCTRYAVYEVLVVLLGLAALVIPVLATATVSAQPVVPGGPGCGKGPPASMLKGLKGYTWLGSACTMDWFLNLWSYRAPSSVAPETVLSLFQRSKSGWHAPVVRFEAAEYFDYFARHNRLPVGMVHLLTLDAWQGWRPPSFIVKADALGEAGGPGKLPNSKAMANCSPFELTTLAQEEGANLYGALALTGTACAAGWAIGQATYYTRTVPSQEVPIAAIFKWSKNAGWMWQRTLVQSQAVSSVPGMPRGLAYDLELQQHGCPTGDPSC